MKTRISQILHPKMFLSAALLLVSAFSFVGAVHDPGLDGASDYVSETEMKHINILALRDSSLLFTNSEEALRYMSNSPDREAYAKGILPKMAISELEYAGKLLNNTHDGFIVVDKERMKVIKFDKFGVEIVSFGMACAKNYGTKHKGWDSRTPEGFFSVKSIHNSEGWHFIDENGVESPKTGEFGPRFIRINTPVSNSIGIHGTSAPWSIGGRRSHGCIRIKNENIMKLVEMVDSGMPVIISPGRKDMEVNAREGYDIPAVSTVSDIAEV